ncbi:hypothetical protein [Streptomyces djakartensis]|jgi:hypothetical protein|uniref:hypothetical protein n=1 Tax=Streptomyces djakartensis TaxID=68193 RepID=UPI0034DFC30B
MRTLPHAVIAALALSALAAPPVRAAVLPADVTPSQCIAGGGMIVISAVGQGGDGYTKRCEGGVHDGQTVT